MSSHQPENWPEHPGISPAGEAKTFTEHLLRVNPTPASLEALAGQADQAPVIMLNLLRFSPRGDNSIYSQYAMKAAPEVKKTGSFVGYYGKTISGLNSAIGLDESWDGIALLVYHRRQSFLDLQRSQNYQQAIPLRTAGVSRRTLYVLEDHQQSSAAATSISQLDTNRQPLDTGEEAIFILDLFAFVDDCGVDDLNSYLQAVVPVLQQHQAVLELSTRCELPVLSEQTWDYCTVTRFPSLASVNSFYQSSAWEAIQSAFEKKVVRNLRVASQGIPIPR